MATQVETPYTAWEFSDAEIPVAMVFTDLQYKHLQNELAAVATERVVMAVPQDGTIEVYLRTQEYLRGKMEQITALLITSDNQKNALVEALQQASQSQAVDRPKPT